MNSNPLNTASVIQTISPEYFGHEVIAESKIVLLFCMPHDEAFAGQQRVLEEIAGIYGERVKVVLPEEAFIEVFKRNLNIVGTPTLLIFKKGKENFLRKGILNSLETIIGVPALSLKMCSILVIHL